MPTIHPLPVNPTTGQQPLASLRSYSGSNNQTAAGGVNREVLKQLQDVAWSDDEVSAACWNPPSCADKPGRSRLHGVRRATRLVRSEL